MLPRATRSTLFPYTTLFRSVTEKDDIAGVQLAVVQVVLKELAKEGMDEPPSHKLWIDVVLLEPGVEPRGIGTKHFDIVRHQCSMNEFQHQDTRRVIP